ncbi:orexin receptor type 2-like [Saccostrea echinata]|uniref:orexin receptor type 2-like n=1 Tax=Saccostrea echinata TaxID=191078 RepID=UPI002A7F8F42|nr:orexin receptor type 2-like [Saccostrea echinata]
MINNRNATVLNYTYIPEDYILWIANERLYEINKPTVVILILLILFGMFGNLLVIYVFGFRLQKSTVHTYIISLSAFDTLTCLLLIFEVFDKRFPMYSGNFPEICKVVRCLEVFANGCASLIMASIAFDRFYKVWKPFKRLSIRTVKKSILGIVITMVVLSWPMAIFHGPETVSTIYTTIRGTDCADDDRFKGSVYTGIYFLGLFVIILSCLVEIVVMYLLVFINILKWKRNVIGENIPTTSNNSRQSSYSSKQISRCVKQSKRNRQSTKRDSIFDNDDSVKRHDSLNKPDHKKRNIFKLKKENDVFSDLTKSISAFTICNRDESNFSTSNEHEAERGSKRKTEIMDTPIHTLADPQNSNAIENKMRNRDSFYKPRYMVRRQSGRVKVKLGSTTAMFSLIALIFTKRQNSICTLTTMPGSEAGMKS